MEAKDTVLNDEELAKAVWGEWNAEHLRVAQAQAEISFKAGIKEVVEWIKDTASLEEYKDGRKWRKDGMLIPWDEWQAQLKEWGLDNDSTK